MGKLIDDEGYELHYIALSRQVLTVFVAQDRSGWASYIYPMSDSWASQREEAKLWRTKGQKLQETVARAIWPSLAKEFDERGRKYRP